jgi:SnoaL-like domain
MTDLEQRVAAIEDRNALTDLLSTYCRSLDDADHAGLRACVTDDLHAEHGDMIPPIDGGDAFITVVEHAPPTIQRWQHYVSNVEITVDGDTATMWAFLHAWHEVDLGDGYQLVPAGGRYEIDAVRTSTGWRIKRLVVHHTWEPPEIAKIYAGAG